MPNPRAQRPLSLQAVTEDIRSLAQPAQAMLDMLAGAAKGSVSATAGVGGDLESLARGLALAYRAPSGQRMDAFSQGLDQPTFLPTTADVSAKLPDVVPQTAPLSRQHSAGYGQTMGEFIPTPGSGRVVQGALNAVKSIPAALQHGAQEFAVAAGQSGPRIFIGPKAKTFDQIKLEKAQALEKQGADPVDIWRQTGTFKGADGIWRQEISDQSAKFLTPEDRALRIAENKLQIDKLKEQIAPTPQKDLFPKALTEAKKEARETVSELKGENKMRERNPRTQGLNAQYIFEHPELYKAYPQLRNVNINTEVGGGNTLGSLSIIPSRGQLPGVIEMDISKRGLERNPTSTALHEMQHAVQTIEGMHPGGSSSMAFTDPRAHEMLQKERLKMLKALPYEDFVRQGGYTDMEMAGKDYIKYTKDLQKGIDPAYDRMLQERVGQDYYERLAGEAEARAAQDRQMLSNKERLDYFPFNSYDVDPEKLIVKPPREFKDGGKVHISDNTDAMMMELGERKYGIGGKVLAGAKAGSKAASADVKPSLVIKSNPGMIVSNLIDEEPDIAKRMGAEARAKRQLAIEAEGKRKELAAQTQPSVGYRKSTEKSPDPLVGTRFVNDPAFGLKANDPFDLSKYEGANALVLPWDSQSRNVRTTQVSGVDLPNQIFRETHGGIPYSFDLGHVKKGIAGASGLEIAKRVKTRADIATKDSLRRGGSGEVLHIPITMGFRGEDYALPYSEFSFEFINHKLATGELNMDDAYKLSNMVRNYSPPGYKGQKPFADFKGFTDPEGLNQIYTGEGLKAPPGDLRKAIADRIIWQKGSQEMLGFNAEDLMNATTYEPLRGVGKGVIGASVIRNTPTGMTLSPSAGKYPYDTDFSGEHLGRLNDLVDVEALFYRTLNPIKRELMERENKIPYTRDSLRNAAIGAIEKRNEGVSQAIDQQFLDDYMNYVNELNKPHEYRRGGVIKKAAGGEITADDLTIEERPL